MSESLIKANELSRLTNTDFNEHFQAKLRQTANDLAPWFDEAYTRLENGERVLGCATKAQLARETGFSERRIREVRREYLLPAAETADEFVDVTQVNEADKPPIEMIPAYEAAEAAVQENELCEAHVCPESNWTFDMWGHAIETDNIPAVKNYLFEMLSLEVLQTAIETERAKRVAATPPKKGRSIKGYAAPGSYEEAKAHIEKLDALWSYLRANDKRLIREHTCDLLGISMEQLSEAERRKRDNPSVDANAA
jgi:hypothetical protein